MWYIWTGISRALIKNSKYFIVENKYGLYDDSYKFHNDPYTFCNNSTSEKYVTIGSRGRICYIHEDIFNKYCQLDDGRLNRCLLKPLLFNICKKYNTI